MVNQPGWAVRLEGDQFDVDALRDRLPTPFDPWVEEYADVAGKGLVLRSNAWANLAEPRDVEMDADRMLERLHGEALLYDADAMRVLPSQVFKFGADGSRHTFIIVHSASIRFIGGRIRVRGAAPRHGSPLPPAESETQRWFREAEADENRSELFSHVSNCESWFDIFKTMELAKRILGSKTSLNSKLDSDKIEWNRIWQTANCYRHAPDPVKYPLPNPPAMLDEARLLVLRVVRRLI